MTIGTGIRIEGIPDAVAGLRAEGVRKPAQFKRGLTKAALLVQREAQKRTPVDTGMLRNSAYTRHIDTGRGRFDVVVGFTAAYAIFVHENLNAHHPVGEAKFLENAVRASLPNIRRVVASEMGL
jgi:hypothetical protein